MCIVVLHCEKERSWGGGRKGQIVQSSEVKVKHYCLVAVLLELHVPQFFALVKEMCSETNRIIILRQCHHYEDF